MQQHPLEALAMALRTARIKKNVTQQQVADKLHMNVRTVIQIEKCRSNPKFETVALLAKELDINLNALVFPDTVPGTVSKSVTDFFAGKSEAEIQKFIALCQQAEELKSEK